MLKPLYCVLGLSALPLPVSVVSVAVGQEFRRGDQPSHQITRIYDRVADSTRLTLVVPGSSRPFGLKSRAWLDISLAYKGTIMRNIPTSVVLTFESFTPSRGGWAFAKPRELRVSSGKRVLAKIPASSYQKRRVRLLDSGRREILSYTLPTDQFVNMAAESELNLQVGGGTIRLRQRMELLRAIAHLLMAVERGK